jgi:hypothetical protein
MVAKLTTFCFVGFGTDKLRREEAMKTARKENPIHGVTLPRNRAHGAVGQGVDFQSTKEPLFPVRLLVTPKPKTAPAGLVLLASKASLSS